MRLTIEIPDANSIKATPLIEYLKSLDFISIIPEEDISVPDWHKKIITERINNSDNSKLLDWEKIKNTFKLDENV